MQTLIWFLFGILTTFAIICFCLDAFEEMHRKRDEWFRKQKEIQDLELEKKNSYIEFWSRHKGL